MAKRLALVLFGLVCCDGVREGAPRGEALFVVDTDVAVPELVSKLRVDIYREDGTWIDSRTFMRTANDWPSSFSVYVNGTGASVALVRLRAYPDGVERDYHGERYLEPPAPTPADDDVPEGDPTPGETPRLLIDKQDATPRSEPTPFAAIDRLVRVRLEYGTRGSARVTLHGECFGRMADLANRSTCIDEKTSWTTAIDQALDPNMISECRRGHERDRLSLREGNVRAALVFLAFAVAECTAPVALPQGQVGATKDVLRLRMYPSFASQHGEVPFSTAVIDVLAAIPEVAATGILERHVVLHVDDVGFQRGSFTEPIALELGAGVDSVVGTWPGATVVPCNQGPLAAEVCIPGGAFWMGNRQLLDDGFGTGSEQLRLVVLSPFSEIAVAQFRDSGLAATPWSGGTSGDFIPDYCTMSSDPSHDQLPINCLAWATASVYCGKRNAVLPTEAQFEYVASNLNNSLYVWGNDRPKCGDAAIERGGVGIYYNYAPDCRPVTGPGGVVEITTSRKDHIGFNRGTAFDLVGNVREWVRDTWNRESESCWTAGGVYLDPLCQTPSVADGFAHATRGGAFIDTPRLAAAAARNFSIEANPLIGFRCVRPDN